MICQSHRRDRSRWLFFIDLKNITIGSSNELQSWTYQGIIGQWYSQDTDPGTLAANESRCIDRHLIMAAFLLLAPQKMMMPQIAVPIQLLFYTFMT